MENGCAMIASRLAPGWRDRVRRRHPSRYLLFDDSPRMWPDFDELFTDDDLEVVQLKSERANFALRWCCGR